MGWIQNQFELSRGGHARNVLPMEGLRGFAVFLVFLVHYSTLMSPWITPRSGLEHMSDLMHRIGNTGVDLFFVLSGYLIYGSLIKKKKPFVEFMRQRIKRIYPAFTIVFILYLGLSFYFPGTSKIPSDSSRATWYVLANYLLLPGIFDIEPIITVSWSLSYEMFYYLVTPIVILAFDLRARARRWRMWFFAGLSAALIMYCARESGPVRLAMFIAGILLHESLAGKRFRLGTGLAVFALIGGLFAMTVPVPGSGAFAVKTTILALSFFTVCHVCFDLPSHALARAFSWTPLRWLGNMSYSYYLLHGLALQVALRALHAVMPTVSHETAFFLGMLPVLFAVTLVPTIGLFLLIERPFSLTQQAGKSGVHFTPEDIKATTPNTAP